MSLPCSKISDMLKYLKQFGGIMKVKTYKYTLDREVEKDNTRVKAFIINSKKEMLLVLSQGGCQLPGGHLEDGEYEITGLKRELKEETGGTYKGKFIKFFATEYTGTNGKSSKVSYYYILTDSKPNKALTHYTENEKKNNFKLIKLPFTHLPEIMEKIRHETTVPINIAIIDELKIAYGLLKEILEKESPTQKAGCYLIDIKTQNVALIYREQQKDYSFPKGHLEENETLEECAIRETAEETKRVAKITNHAPLIERYTTPKGEHCKTYMYIAIDQGKSDNTSTDTHEVIWTPIKDVEAKLSYESLKTSWKKVLPQILKLLDK